MNKHESKMAKKRAAKAAKRDAYKSLAGTSQKGKRKRKKKSVEPSGKKHSHAMANCGNSGCKLCKLTTKNKKEDFIGYWDNGQAAYIPIVI